MPVLPCSRCKDDVRCGGVDGWTLMAGLLWLTPAIPRTNKKIPGNAFKLDVEEHSQITMQQRAPIPA